MSSCDFIALNDSSIRQRLWYVSYISFEVIDSSDVTIRLYPASFFAFSIASSFISSLIFPSSLFPFLSVGIKVTYFEQSPNSDLLACEVFRLWAFFNQFINLVYVFFCKLRIKVNGK